MAVRHLKCYASWVQTVYALKAHCDANIRIMRMIRMFGAWTV